MKVIINGLRYDTANATLIGEASYSGPQEDRQWWKAGLYKTPRAKRYFLAGQGASMTRWAKRLPGGAFAPGQRITPLKPDEAREWAEYYLTLEEQEAAFGPEIEDA